MTPAQYDEFLGDLRTLRRSLGLPDGALAISPRMAFLECIEAAVAVREDERRAIAAWLRSEVPHRRAEVRGLLIGLADDIEAGEHTDSTGTVTS